MDDPLLDPLDELMRQRREGLRTVMVTVVAVTGSVPRQAGAKMLVLPDGSIRGTIGGGVREAEVVRAAKRLLKRGGSRLLTLDFQEGTADEEGPLCGGSMEVFMERIDPPRRVVIAGAGHIGFFLHRILALLGWNTVVFDERPEFASGERFPGAALHVQPFAGGLAELTISPNDAVVVITPEHKFDQVVLKQALETEAGYVGMIGSKKKVKTIFDNLRAEGVAGEQIDRVHSPIGLDIGAESPAEIALAIAAEIVGVFKRKK